MKTVHYYTTAPPLTDPGRGSHVPTTERGKRKGEGGKRRNGRR